MPPPPAPDALRATIVEGLPADIDTVAAAAAPSHRFLRHGWFAAAIAAYGGRPRTILVTQHDSPVLALPIVAQGPAILGLAAIPGSYWPFRSVPLATDAHPATASAALAVLATAAHGLRLGPVYDGDPAAIVLIAAARGAGWTVLDRFVARSWAFDLAGARAEGAWPRASTLKKNRFHEKHLAAHGVPDWTVRTGVDWPAAFDALAAVEQASWLSSRTDGHDAKFTARGHGAFWRAAAADPVLAGMMRAALLTIDGRPAAFSFDLETGALCYAIANSYDPAIGKHSPGRLLHYRNLADAAARGVEQVDWGAGDSGYKEAIGAVPGPAIRDWLMLRPGWPALAGRRLRQRWRRSGRPEA